MLYVCAELDWDKKGVNQLGNASCPAGPVWGGRRPEVRGGCVDSWWGATGAGGPALGPGAPPGGGGGGAAPSPPRRPNTDGTPHIESNLPTFSQSIEPTESRKE